MNTEDRAKEVGMARAESANMDNVRTARQIARELCADGRAISMDDVRAEMTKRHPGTVYGAWCGSVWVRGEFRPVGFTNSKVPGSHSNLLRLWQLRVVPVPAASSLEASR